MFPGRAFGHLFFVGSPFDIEGPISAHFLVVLSQAEKLASQRFQDFLPLPQGFQKHGARSSQWRDRKKLTQPPKRKGGKWKIESCCVSRKFRSRESAEEDGKTVTPS